jgi:hypothetical protein
MKIRITEQQQKNLLEYYKEKLSSDEKEHQLIYHGKNVIWYGDPIQMIYVHKSDVEGMSGNIYYPEKIEYLYNMIKDAEDKIELTCSHATGDILNLTDAVEEQQALAGGYFHESYDGKTTASSTGEQHLDTYIGAEDIEYYFDGYSISDEVLIYMEKNKTKLAFEMISLEELKNGFHHFELDSEEIEAIQQYLKLEMELVKAVKNSTGDLNKFRVTLRDAHHRVKAAIKAGEEYICVNLDIADIKTYKGKYNKV